MKTSPYKRIKLALYRLAKSAGLFGLCSRLLEDRLLILCYHGISLADEHVWNPQLFIPPRTLKQRLRLLNESGRTVLPLDEAIRRRDAGTLPKRSTVITFDDGFYNNHALGLPILKEARLPFTIYTSSYYVRAGSPVFRLALQYLFWKTSVASCDLSNLHPALAKIGPRKLMGSHDRASLVQELTSIGERELSNPERDTLLSALASILEIDFKSIDSKRLFHFMTPQELKEIDESGFGRIELHTHRHLHLSNEGDAEREIQDNKRVLEPILGRELSHFCYPSGVWSQDVWPALERCGIQSATTCDSGMISNRAHAFGLPRYLDSADVSDIEFEAEISGFAESLRCVRSFFRPRQRTANSAVY